MPHVHRFKKLSRIDIPGAARFLTFSCIDQRPIFASDELRRAFVPPLVDYARSGRIELHAWVLMPDHVHLLLTPMERELAPSLSEFKEAVVRSVTTATRAPQRVWRPGGGHDRTIYSCGEFREKRRYIHLNAFRAGLCDSPEGWKWHSWHEVEAQAAPSREADGLVRHGMPLVWALSAERLRSARSAWTARGLGPSPPLRFDRV